MNNSKTTIETPVNLLELLAIAAVILTAYAFQLFGNEIPCPLCLLQRLGFLSMAFGMLLNLQLGSRPIHYGLTILSALYTMIVAGRQILLHIAPGTGSYGSALFGIHFYTWSFIMAALFILLNVIILVFDHKLERIKIRRTKSLSAISHLFMALVILLTASNIVTTFLECGFKQCPSDPKHYIVKKDQSPGHI